MNLSLNSVTVENFRGVEGTERYKFAGENAVIFGPNGSGKSTALQAIEFLLTGEIDALRGSGTGGVKTNQHIPNLSADPDNTVVRATFEDSQGEFHVHRRFTDRSELTAERRPTSLNELLDVANRGYIQLTRADILELIFTTPGNRKEQIYQLLNTGELDDRRLRIKGVERKASQETNSARQTAKDALGRIKATVHGPLSVDVESENPSIDDKSLLAEIDERRERLNGPPLQSLSTAQSFTEGVESPVEQASHPLQRSDVRRDINLLHSWMNSVEEHQMTLDHTRRAITALQADAEALTSLSELSLIQKGHRLVDEATTVCPLCGESWTDSDLQSHLQQRIERLERIEQRRDELVDQASDLLSVVREPVDPLLRLLELTDKVSGINWAPVRSFIGRLQAIAQLLEGDIVTDVETIDADKLNVDLKEITPSAPLDQLEKKANDLPDQSELQKTWDELTTLFESYRAWEDARDEISHYETVEREMSAAKREYLAARDEILGETFTKVEERFGELYTLINPDEASFDPQLDQTNTGVKFTVGVQAGGRHPPNALHSEGHQDLMGIALFLALVEQSSPLDRTPVLLDDVLMSVDRTHRTRLAEGLSTDLSDKFQFILTTHDTSWAQQLNDVGTVPDRNLINTEKQQGSDIRQ